jgi:hypothetical protein
MALPREARWLELGAASIGVKLDPKIHGAELMPRSRHTSSHVNCTQKMTLDLGVNCCGVVPRVYILK